MKTPAIALGLALLTACHPSPEAASIDQNAAMIERSLEQQADMMEALANNTADAAASQALQNAADHLEDTKANVADSAAAAKDRLHR